MMFSLSGVMPMPSGSCVVHQGDCHRAPPATGDRRIRAAIRGKSGCFIFTREDDSHPPRRGRATRRCGTVGVWPAISVLLGVAVSSSYYEIRVAGVLPPEALLDFERLTASVEPVETVVHGQLRDQAALHGLLARLEAFGVEVLEVRRLYERDPPAGETSR